MPSKEVTYEYAVERLSYDKEAGIIVWKNGKFPGQRAGTDGKHGRYVNLHNVPRKEHRIIWLLMTGSFPNGEIDHINRNPFDNRWENLRDVDRMVNCHNTTARKSNTSGFKGVSWSIVGSMWIAQLTSNGKSQHLGYFKIKEDAARAYDKAVIEARGDNAVTNFPKEDYLKCA